MVVEGVELGGRDHADLPVEPSLVEPVDVLEGRVLDVVESPPGSVVANHLRLVEPVERLGQGVVVAIPAGTHGRRHTGVGKALRVADRQILGEFNQSSQHRTGRWRGDYDYTEAAFGWGRTSQTALARPTIGWAA